MVLPWVQYLLLCHKTSSIGMQMSVDSVSLFLVLPTIYHLLGNPGP